MYSCCGGLSASTSTHAVVWREKDLNFLQMVRGAGLQSLWTISKAAEPPRKTTVPHSGLLNPAMKRTVRFGYYLRQLRCLLDVPLEASAAASRIGFGFIAQLLIQPE